MSSLQQKLLHDQQAAAFWHAIALRRLHNYRAARHSVEQHGGDVSDLIEPPPYPKLTESYTRLIEEFIDQGIDRVHVARTVLDLLAAIAQDQQFTGILEDASIVGDDRDKTDMVRLIGTLSGWINKLDIAEAIAVERGERA